MANYKGVVIALMGVLVPWACGYSTAQLFGYNNEAAMFIGTATATSIAITANVLHELGLVTHSFS